MSPKQGLLCTEIVCALVLWLPLALLTSSQMWDFTHTFYSWLYQHTPYPSDWVFSWFRGEIGKTTFCPKGFATKTAYFVENLFLKSISSLSRHQGSHQ